MPFHNRRIAYRLTGGHIDRAALDEHRHRWIAVVGACVDIIRDGPLGLVGEEGRERPERGGVQLLRQGRDIALRHDHSLVGVPRQDHGHRFDRRTGGAPVHVLDECEPPVVAVMRQRLRSVLVQEDGIALVLVILIASFMTLLSVTLIDRVRAEATRGHKANNSSTAFQAAEAGIDDYVAKLVDDHGFFLHYVAPAESTRSPSSSVTAPHSSDCTAASSYGPKTTMGVAWTYGTAWTYPSGKDNWCQLPNGYYYNLQVYPPGSTLNPTTSVRIVGTGRKSMSNTDDMRAIETYVRPSNLTDFYRFSDGDVSIDATTYGKIYSNGNVSHTGTAHADIFAEGSITGNPTMADGAQKYANGAFPATKIKNHPIDFSKFLVSLVDIKRAAQVGGIYLNQAGAPAGGSRSAPPGLHGRALLRLQPSERAGTDLHAGDRLHRAFERAIYTDVDAIVSGPVNGRVTVGSGQNIVVAGNIAPVTGGDDVIGLVAYSDLWVAAYAPNVLTWNAAILVETNTWHSTGSSHGAGSLMTFTGSAATATGGSFGEYAGRVYAYDQNLIPAAAVVSLDRRHVHNGVLPRGDAIGGRPPLWTLTVGSRWDLSEDSEIP